MGKDKEKIMGFMDELREEGERQGRQAGSANILLGQLTARFGPVPAGARARIQAADEATLTRWSIRVLSESTLAAVLDNAPERRPRPAKKAARGGKAARASQG